MILPWVPWAFAGRRCSPLTEGKAIVDEGDARCAASGTTSPCPPTRHDPDHDVYAPTLAPA
ncbi:hypothetical protein [Streptomyces sp. NBC_00582]|uniref:hypothetical protein n=1 Tax=Streptomyces sp. NBC_00582 TaxID=2975783 RepID=UPI002E805971|nr:hypothetical protein [Streptomyces sp. NBC_00582]WUB61681.1 hypothetical protein OG852_15390 [Streptomyces sp. NBC_00582]